MIRINPPQVRYCLLNARDTKVGETGIMTRVQAFRVLSLNLSLLAWS